MKKEEKQETYLTRDLYLATTLVALKFNLMNVTYQQEGSSNRPVGYFEFKQGKNLEDAVDKYWRGELAVEPRDWINIMRGLKSQVTSIYKSPFNN